MDAVDPALVDRTEHALHAIDGVCDVTAVRLRWFGHTDLSHTERCRSSYSPC